jgi:hypothetical protein
MSDDTGLGMPLNDTAKVLLIVDLLLKRAKQEGLREDKADELLVLKRRMTSGRLGRGSLPPKPC